MKKHMINNKSSIPYAVAIGVAISVVITVLGALLGTILANNGLLLDNRYLFLQLVIWFIASFLGALIAVKLSEKQLLLVTAITLAAYYLILLGCGILFFNSAFETAWWGIGAVLAGGIPSVFIFARKNTSVYRKKRFRIG